MKTKTIMFGVIAMLAITMLSSSLVTATSDNTPAPKISSGKVFWKGVGLWFTFNQEKKMEREMELAQLRLQQAEFAAENNLTKKAEKSLEAYNRLVQKANKRSQLIQSKDANASIEKLAAMDQAILAHQARIEKLSNLLLNGNLTEEQKAKLQLKISHARNVTLHLQEVQSEKEEKLKTRIMAQQNLTEKEADERLDKAKDEADELVGGAKEAWKNFKEDARSKNMTPGELAKQRREEYRAGARK